MNLDYKVELESFRGPLDLLLFLVKRQEIDICDIPIARITEQFIEYLKIIEIIDVERAGDFLVMAASLMEIKSRMLLPRTDPGGEDQPDPRLELVQQLVEYKRFKDAAHLLEARAEEQLFRIPRSPVDVPTARDAADQSLHTVELWDLVSAYGRLLRETLALKPQQIVVDETPTHVYQDMIIRQLQAESLTPFANLFSPPRTRARLVGIFLALLELVKTGQVIARQESPYGDIYLLKHPNYTPARPA